MALGDLTGVEVLDALPPAPAGGDGMGAVGLEPAVFPREEGGDARGVDDPPRPLRAGAPVLPVHVTVWVPPSSRATSRTRAGRSRLAPSETAVDRTSSSSTARSTWYPGKRTLYLGPSRCSRRARGSLVVEPEAHPLLHQVLLVQVVGEPEDAAQEVGAGLDRGLAHAPSEPVALLDDQDAPARVAPAQQQRRRRAGEGAPENDHVPSFRSWSSSLMARLRVMLLFRPGVHPQFFSRALAGKPRLRR
jgi:hypothetical protein